MTLEAYLAFRHQHQLRKLRECSNRRLMYRRNDNNAFRTCQIGYG